MNARDRFSVKSFQVRMALWSTALSAAVLLAFGAWAWAAVQRTSLRSIDDALEDLAERHLTAPGGPQHWERLRDSIELGARNRMAFLVRGRGGETLYRSELWPDELDAAAFPTPIDAGFLEPPPEPPRRIPGAMEPPRPDTGPGDRRRFGRQFRAQPPPQPPGPRVPPPAMRIVPTPFFTHAGGETAWRIAAMTSPERTVVIGLDLGPYTAEMRRLRRLFLIAAPCALLAIGLSGWWLAKRAMRPVEALTRVAESITAQGLDRRIPAGEADVEFARLIHVFNGMLDRLERSFQQTARFSADAAHELKTPLTILQGELAQAVQSAEPGSDQQQGLVRLLEEVQRLKSITRKLLLLSLADAGQLRPHMEPTDLSALIEIAKDDVEALDPTLRVHAIIQPHVQAALDADLFRQVLQNLVGNAVKYNVPHGAVALHLRAAGDRATFTIANAGPGIPEADRDRVFERFYRADKARNRRVDGVGLGLSLSREIVRAHGGELRLARSEPGRTEFAVDIPATAMPVVEARPGSALNTIPDSNTVS